MTARSLQSEASFGTPKVRPRSVASTRTDPRATIDVAKRPSTSKDYVRQHPSSARKSRRGRLARSKDKPGAINNGDLLRPYGTDDGKNNYSSFSAF